LIVAQMLFLSGEDPEKDVQLYINSPGGSITAGLQFTTPCSSSRTTWSRIALPGGQHGDPSACGTKGKRFALPNSRILIHQPSMVV